MNQANLKSISVVIPAKNEEKFIAQCLKSLVEQNYPSHLFELILVDNGSTDNTIEIAKKFEKIKISTVPNVKVGAVRNYGAAIATNEIIAFIDADCIAPTNWLLNISDNISPNKVLGGGVMLPDQAKAIERYWLLEGPDGHNLPKELIGACCVVMKADFAKIGGFDENVTSGEDSDFSLKARRLSMSVTLIREISVVHLGNAKSTLSFIKRQIWHSENYLLNISKLRNDPIFMLTLTFCALIYSLICGLILDLNITFVAIFSVFSISLILSLKRIKRSKHKVSSLHSIVAIIYLDFIYLVGRSIGLHKSIFRKLRIIK